MVRRRWVKTAVIAFLLLIIVVGFVTGVIPALWIIGSTDIKEKALRTRFDSIVWKNPQSKSGEYSMRQRMVDDLASHHRLLGLSRKQVIDLLGQPDNGSKKEYRYNLGLERGWLKIDYETLIVEFDSRDRVVRVRR